MEKYYGESWMHRKFRCWTAVVCLLTLGILVAVVDGGSEICKQQQQSSFRLKRLASSSKSKTQCTGLCCKDKDCTIPLRVNRHCYGISCERKELCQIVFEQLKDFQGHRVDKRDADEDDEDDNSRDWISDHGKALGIYQKRETLGLNTSDVEQSLLGKRQSTKEPDFPAFLITRSKRNSLEDGFKKNAVVFNNQSNYAANETNQFFVSFDNPKKDAFEKESNVTKRSSDEEEEDEMDEDDDGGDDDVDGDDNADTDRASNRQGCSRDSKFHQSVIPHRRKNYHFKRLERKSRSLKTCGKRCCRTDNCILSFMLERACIGVLCSGDGDCHTRKDDLPKTSFELSVIKRKAADAGDGSSENDEQKRSTVQSKDDDDDDVADDDDDRDDGDIDGEVDGDDEEEEEKPKNKKHSKHEKKSKKKRKKTSTKKKKSHAEHKSRKKKHSHKHSEGKTRRHGSHKAKKSEEVKEENRYSGSGDAEEEKKEKEKEHPIVNEASIEDEHKDGMEQVNVKYDDVRRKFSKDEYSDDVRHLIRHQKPMNSTLFDDTIVGTEADNHDQERGSSETEDQEHANRLSEVAEQPEAGEEEEYLRKHLQEEKAGMADESVKMRMSSFENDKRNDLMIAHRHFEEVADPSTDKDERRYDVGDEYRPKHYKHLSDREWEREPDERLHEYHKKYARKGHLGGDWYAHRHTKHHDDARYGSEVDRDDYSTQSTQPREERRYEEPGRSQSHSYRDEDETSGSGEQKERQHSSRHAKEHFSTHHSPHHAEHSHGAKGHSRDTKGVRKSSSSQSSMHKSSHHRTHSHGSKKKTKSKSSGMNNEEKLIEKLEHLEEKIERKQKSEIENRKEKILQKFETLANKLEKKASSGKSKKKDRKKSKSHREKNKKKKSQRDEGEELKAKESEKKMTDELEASGAVASIRNEVAPERIVIPLQDHQRHKQSSKKSSSKEKKHHQSNVHKAKEHLIESSGESSATSLVKEREETRAEGSGGGEDDDGDVSHYLGFERDHKVDDTNWSQRQLIVPYIEKKSHKGHQPAPKMPVLNENILDGLDKVRYEKKDKIAKPSTSDKDALKNEIIKVKNESTAIESKHKEKKSHVSKKRKGKAKSSKPKHGKKSSGSSKKITEKEKLLKELEKYKAFVKSQAMTISGDGSGEDGSGATEVRKKKTKSEKKKSKKKKKKLSHEDAKESKKEKHKAGRKKSAKKHKDVSKKKSYQKHIEELTSSGHSEGSGEEVKNTPVEEEKQKDAKKKSGGSKEKKRYHPEREKHIDDKKKEKDATKGKNEEMDAAEDAKMLKHNDTSEVSKPKEDETATEKGPKPFHDRKETAAGDLLEGNNTASVAMQNNSARNTHDAKSKNIQSNLHHGEAAPEKNMASWSGVQPKSSKGSNSNTDSKHIKPEPTHHLTSSPPHENKTAEIQESSAKRVGAPVQKTTTVAPTTKATTVMTTHKTTLAATKKRKETTKRKPKKVKTAPTTKPTVKTTKKTTIKTTAKAMTYRLTTTSIPTLSILTGDEDVEPEAQPTRPEKAKTSRHEAKQAKPRKPTKASKNVKAEAKKKIPKRKTVKKTTKSPHSTPNHVETESRYQPLPVQPNIQTKSTQQQFPGQGGSSGVLGDLQLPEPPANGNRASGPPFYGQQASPGFQPMQQPLEQMPYSNMPMGGSAGSDSVQLINGGGQNQEGSIGNVPEMNDQPVMPTMKPIQSNQYFGYSPVEKPTPVPQVQNRNEDVMPPIAPQHNQLPPAGPQSPHHVIQRILGAPHKPSPLKIIENILKPKIAAHIENHVTSKSKPIENTSPQGKGQGGNVKSHKPNEVKGPILRPGKTKPSPTKKKALPTGKKQSPTKRKPSSKAKPSKKEEKQPLGRLSDFFKNANNPNEPKNADVPKNAKVPKPNIPQKKAPESSAPVSPREKQDGSCPVRQNLANMVLTNGRKSGVFTRMQGYPPLDACIKQCCKIPTCDLLFKSGEVCYLVKCHNPDSCKTEPLKEPTMRTRIVYVTRPEPKAKPAKPAACEGESAYGITWKETKPGNFAARACPKEARGMVKRQCNDHANWQAPDFSGCTSDEYANLNENAKHLGFTSNVKDVLLKLEEITTQTIDNSLIFGGDILKASIILDQISKFVEKNHVERFGFGALRNFARSASNLLDETNKQEWENVNHSLKGPGKIMNALEKFGVITAEKIPPISNNKPVVTNNMVMSVARISKGKKYSFPNYSMPILKRWTTKRDQIILPAHLFQSGPVKVASVNYKTLAQLLPHQWSTANHVTFTDGFRVNSKVIATSISPEPKDKISPPVTVVLHHLKEINTLRTKCVHWDFKSNAQNGGSWSSDGCWVVTSNATVTVCQCDHLTHFAVLMNLSDEDRVSAKEQAKENTFALMWLGIPVLVVLSVGAMYTCFAWSKAPRRRHVVVKDGKPRLPEDEVIVTKTIKEDFPGSPNRYLYSSYTSPSPSDLEWEHVWDFLTNSEFENWQCTGTSKRKKPRRRRLDLRPSRLLRGRKKKLREKFETSEYFSEGDSSSIRWKHQDENEWSKDRIKCLGKEMIDISSEASQPVDSLEEFSDDTSVADSKDGDKCSHSFDSFSPDAISSPHSGYCTEPKYYSFVYKSNYNLKERGRIHLMFNAESRLSAERKSHHSSCSSLDTLRNLHPAGVQKSKYASTTCLLTIGRNSGSRLGDRKWSSKVSLASSMKAVTHSMSSGFLDKTWSSKYASSLSISTLARSFSTKTINEDIEGFPACYANSSSEQGYGTFESSGAFSTDVMDMNITSSDVGFETDSGDLTRMVLSTNVPTYDMNLLTPSKKSMSLIEKPIESSSIDNLCMEDFDKDIEQIENMFDNDSENGDQELLELRDQTQSFLKEAFIMNMELFGSELKPKKDENATANATVTEATENAPGQLDNISGASFVEDLGMDTSSCSVGRSPTCEYASIESLQQQSIHDVDTEILTSDDNLCPCEPMTKTVKERNRRRSAIRTNGIFNMPRTSNIKKKTKIVKKRSERVSTIVTGITTRSPTKHMRSYIVLRQQSRYSDHERHTALTTQDEQDSASGTDCKIGKKQRKPSVKLRKTRARASAETVEDSEIYQVEEIEKEQRVERNADETLDESEAKIDFGIETAMVPGKAVCISKSKVACSDVNDTSFMEEDDTRRCLETSVFGSTLKRWKGRSKLHSSRNINK